MKPRHNASLTISEGILRITLMIGPFRKTARHLLRGPLLEYWVQRKDRLLDASFSSALVRSGKQPALVSAKPRSVSAGKVNAIVLIADVMWESHQLVPELEKIAPVTVIDINAALREEAGSLSASETVSRAVGRAISSPNIPEPDVVLLYARGSLLSFELFDLLRKKWRCPLLGMNLDDKVEFYPHGVYAHGNDGYSDWAGHFDLNLTSSLTAEKWYRQLGVPCHYVAMGFHSGHESAAPPTSAKFEHLISFVGSRKRERAALVEQLLAAGLPVALFGSGWPNAKWIDQVAPIYRASQLNLGIGFATSTGGIVNLKARDFECPGAGACYLTSYNWELALHYEIGKEILCYRSPTELLEMYHYYSARPEECLQIAQAAHRRCAAEHTWERRFRNAFRECGFRT
jgi:Glycosyl transferases group 1